MSVEITDNSKEVSAAIKAALLRGLEKCGLVAEGYSKKLCPVDTGNLRNSITHVVDEQEPAAIIGTDSEYGAYVELGTGIYARRWRRTAYTVGVSGRKGKLALHAWQQGTAVFETCCRRPCHPIPEDIGGRTEIGANCLQIVCSWLFLLITAKDSGFYKTIVSEGTEPKKRR